MSHPRMRRPGCCCQPSSVARVCLTPWAKAYEDESISHICIGSRPPNLKAVGKAASAQAARPERLSEPQHRHEPHRLRGDPPVHLALAVLAVAEDDRHLDDPEAPL